MNSHLRSTIADRLNRARLALNNTQKDATLSALVGSYGYTAEKLDEGWQLYNAANAAVNTQAAALGTRRQATADAAAAEVRARASYQALAQLARAVFPIGSAQRATLGLVRIMPQRISEFLASAHTLFKNAANVPEVSAALAAYGYDSVRLANEYAVIIAFDAAYAAQAAASGAAQQTTRVQRAALSTLDRWIAQYLKIAKIALREQPALIEQIGGGRSGRTPAQRAAPRKAAATRAARQADAEPQAA